MKTWCVAVLMALWVGTADGIPRVHVVAHSHNDPGWLFTEEQYYDQRTKAIITEVVKALEDNEARIFHWVEQVYFRRWWLAQTRVKQESVRNLIKTKRLVFMTGGLCMNDEATPHHGAIIDQMTWGHRFINATFGDDALPTVGWQIDAFGHSAGYTSLTTDMGLDYFIGQKIDFQDWGARAASEELEFEWTPDPVNKPDKTVFGHVMWDNTQGYSFCCSHVTVADVNATVRLRLAEYKNKEHALLAFGSDFTFVNASTDFEAMEAVMKHINARPEMFGFEMIFSTPTAYFDVIRGSEANAAAENKSKPAAAAGSTRGAGMQQQQQQQQQSYPAYDGDFFPASFSKNYVRSGFYSSRPASKASDRVAWSAGHAAKSLEVLELLLAPTHIAPAVASVVAPPVTLPSTSPSASAVVLAASDIDVAIAAMDAAIGVHQHHDALSGTDLAAVAENYVQMIAAASELVAEAAAAAAIQLAGVHGSSTAAGQCLEMNISVCPATSRLSQSAIADGDASVVAGQNDNGSRNETRTENENGGINITMVLYNPLGRSRNEVVMIPVPIPNVEVLDRHRGNLLQSEVHPSLFADPARGLGWTLYINVTLGPLSVLPLIVRQNTAGKPQAPVQSSLLYYTPAVGNNQSHGWGPHTVDCSSAYAFRPQPGIPVRVYGEAHSHKPPTVTRGVLAQQTHVVVDAAAGVELAVRVLSNDPSVHVMVSTGPLDVSNGLGQEAILRLAYAGLQTRGTWKTDANGLFMMPRTRRANSTASKYVVYEPEAQNYYPATAFASLEGEATIRSLIPSSDDDSTNTTVANHTSAGSGGLAVAFNSAHGVTSPTDGTLEIMLHRRLVDHGCRVDEGYEMNDVHKVVKTFRLQAFAAVADAAYADADGGGGGRGRGGLGDSSSNVGSSLAAAYRFDGLRAEHPISVFFVDGDTATYAMPSKVAAAAVGASIAPQAELPTNVHLHTLKSLSTEFWCDPFTSPACDAELRAEGGSTRAALLRSAHGEVELLVRFQHLFSVGEDTALSAPATVDVVGFLSRFGTVANMVETTLTAAKVINADCKQDLDAGVLLQPMQIRTFVITLQF
eukprot:gene15233-31385_t